MRFNISEKVKVVVAILLFASIMQHLVAVDEPLSVGTSYIFKDVELVPDFAYKTGVDTDVGSIESCLLACTKRSDCKTVVYEGNTCSLYSSKQGVHEKASGQVVVTVVTRDQVTGQDICLKLAPCQHGGTCLPLTTYPYYTCKCYGWHMGERCQGQFSVTNVTLNDGSTVMAPTQDGWIMVLRRQDGSVPFEDRNWTEYENGFGNLDGEFWLGNKWMHLLTTNNSCSVRFDMVAHDGRLAYAVYSNFSIGSEEDDYRLHITGYSGTAANAIDTYSPLCNLNGMPFTTQNRREAPCCGGWWFNNCTYVRLTGQYNLRFDTWNNVVWYGFSKRLAYVDMKIKRI